MAQSNDILVGKGLTKRFGGFTAVDGVDLTVREGAIHALIGPNGAGKTTVFNLLTKFLTPSSGQIFFRGREITAAKPADVAKLGLVRSFQISAVFPKLTVLDNLRVALQRPNGLAIQCWRSSSVLSVLDERALRLIAAVNLQAHTNTPAGQLAYGSKRALEIATTLALDPELLLLDEPMAGMPHEEIGRISSLIREIGKSRTVLMVEHNLSVVADICDYVTVLQRGKILAEGDYNTVSKDPRVREAYMGLEDA
jgi:branched-chain amino acid transport system ATP-binding protein